MLLQTLTVAQLVEKFYIFYGTERFITVFKRTSHWTLSRKGITSHPFVLKTSFINNSVPVSCKALNFICQFISQSVLVLFSFFMKFIKDVFRILV
jgi:hypothetical protein